MTVKFFKSRTEALKEFGSNINDWETSINNVMYGQVIGFYDESELVACASVSLYGTELHIYTFEVAKSHHGEGYGRQCYNMLISLFDDHIYKVTLDYLDYKAKMFWDHIGFVDDPNGETEEAMVLFL